MLYELQLKPLAANLTTAESVLDALADSGATWESEAGSLSCLICTTPAYALEIVLLEDMISLSVPAIHAGQTAREAFDILWRAVRCLQTRTPVPLFDPQLGASISSDNPFDVEKVLLAYAGLVRHLQSFEL